MLENNVEKAVIVKSPVLKSLDDNVLLSITNTVIIHITKTRTKTPSTIPGLDNKSLFLSTIQFSLKTEYIKVSLMERFKFNLCLLN